MGVYSSQSMTASILAFTGQLIDLKAICGYHAVWLIRLIMLFQSLTQISCLYLFIVSTETQSCFSYFSYTCIGSFSSSRP